MSNEFEGSYHSLIIGFIPANNRSEHISTGDPDGSGTKEIYLQFHDDFIHARSGSASQKIPYGRRRMWSEGSTICFQSYIAAESQSDSLHLWRERSSSLLDLSHCLACSNFRKVDAH